ncbi:MAG: DUF393 domain-containing protein [Nitrospirae bacterium]|nr:MAG: DUF393 domain-containing protein [Nitrospirota bacterium]
MRIVAGEVVVSESIQRPLVEQRRKCYAKNLGGCSVIDPAPYGQPPSILLYDGECRLCVLVKEELERHPHRFPFQFVSYQSEVASTLLGASYQPGRPQEAYLVEPNGTIRQGVEAFLPCVQACPGGRIWLLIWNKVGIVRSLIRALYRWVAAHRYRWFGALPSTETKQEIP